MRCTACGTEQLDSAGFCGACGSALGRRCPRCDAETAPGLRFCTSCGAALGDREATPAADPPGPAAERRRVSVLFVDLEGFTALAEALDPEEVRAVQSRYFETARAVIARFGGTVEKFIGDAIVAIWGAPVAHEDDPGRAVRAALGLVREIGRLGGAAARHHLSGRASVATGEAAVSVGAVGQGIVAGDLVNVASRLQSLAPPGGVLVDDTTSRLAHAAATFERVGELELKGRSAPVLAHRARARDVPSSPIRGASHGGPFVGREQELRELLGLHDGVVRDRHGRLVSITGIAGVGKSRLVWEVAGELDRRPGLVAWHAGRAPAYGEGITFAAVAEMVRNRIRAPAGAAPELTGRQLSASLAELVRDDAERRWLEPRLMALLGERLDAFEREDLFAAWRRFFERVSEVSPAVLVFEDLQWADPALVDFIEHLATWTRTHPITIVTLARPEFLDRRSTWGAGVGRFTAIHLERLSDAAMRRLLELSAPRLDDAVVERILEHAGGVPLYAVEVARTLADAAGGTAGTPPLRERRTMDRSRRPVSLRIEVPDSLHGLIAARIDGLPAAERRLLLAAAVLGRRFPLEALVAVGADRATVHQVVSGLVRREFLTNAEAARGAAPNELAFVQEIVRDAAYRTLSHQARRSLHLSAARWLETSTDDDAAEALAGHLSTAHDLVPDHPDATRVARRAVSALRRAATTAMARHVPQQAVEHLERALRLVDNIDQRAVVLDEAASAAAAAGRLDLAEGHLRDLAALQLEGNRRRDAARTRARLAGVLLTAQRHEPAARELESAMRAIRDVTRDAPGVELAAQLARARVLTGDDAGALQWAERGLAAAARLGLDGVGLDLLTTRGTARFNLGDAGGLDDLRQAIDEAARVGSVAIELRARNNLAWLLVADDPRTTLATARQAVEVASAMGVGDLGAQLAEVACAAAFDTGDWEWAITTVEELAHPGTPAANRINLAATAVALNALRGAADPDAALRELEPFSGDLDSQITAGVRLARAWVAFVAGDFEVAEADADAAAAGLLGVEHLQAMALAARACLWSDDRAGATERLARMEAIGMQGRVAEAHLGTVRAGIAALNDPRAGAEAYRLAAGAWRERGLDGDLVICLADRARLLRTAPDAETSAALDRLGASGLRRLIDGEGGSPG